MAMAIQRRLKEIGGTSDLTKALSIAGGVGAGVASGGNPAAISAGVTLGNTVGGISDGDRQRAEKEEAQKKDPNVQFVDKPEDDFDKALTLMQAGTKTYESIPKKSSEPTNGVNVSGDPAYMDQNSAMKRRRKMLSEGS